MTILGSEDHIFSVPADRNRFQIFDTLSFTNLVHDVIFQLCPSFSVFSMGNSNDNRTRFMDFLVIRTAF